MRLLPSLQALCMFTAASFGATLTITPPSIYDCQNGEATATVAWSGASGPVQIHVLKPNGPALTGFNDPSGSTTTGNWVSDGLQFFLVDQAGTVEATATAHVSCGGTASTLTQGLTGGSYFPLQVGNTWVYHYNLRFLTGEYEIRSITGTEVINGLTYYDLSSDGAIIGRLRGDDNGVIWALTTSGDQVYLDPHASGVQATVYTGALGSFSDALSMTSFNGGLEMDQSTFVRGIGLVSMQANMLSGSSGGFLDGLDLIEARLNGVRLTVPDSSLNIGIQTTDLDLTDQLAPNCALPCYFVACGIGGAPPDPPGTYRPCTEVRLETTALQPATATSASNTLQLQLLDSTGAVLFTTSEPTDTALNSFNYIRLPLYTVPASPAGSNTFTVLPAGTYRLVGSAMASGSVVASSTMTVHVR